MRERLEALALLCELHHSEGALDVDVDRIVQSRVEVDARRAVYDRLAVLC